ncbi:MAG TPA: SGNH/GDSL hydrolase family protein [Steroidobacteraceae bacterium]|nr:SGNH/GDSL hydrolase family protein [Steroidobacteraceae bacterium]
MRVKALAFLAVGLLLGPGLQAGPYDAIYAFGDSLSDVGNIFHVTKGVEPAAPYVNGQFSNGPVWVQDLAAGLGVPALTPSLLGGTDYAYGGAQTGQTVFHTATPIDLTGTLGQISQFEATHATADPHALYTIWIGSNDLIGAAESHASSSQIAMGIGEAVSNLDTAIGDLAAEGAKNFLILTVPDIGKTPRAIAGGPTAQAGASALAAAFNSTLINGSGPIPPLASVANGLNLHVFDTFSALDAIIADPGAFGFTNVTSPCLVGEVNHAGGTPCASTEAGQNQYLFWDDIHPTAGGHAAIAAGALEAAAGAPEPTTLALLSLGLAGLGLMRGRRKN